MVLRYGGRRVLLRCMYHSIKKSVIEQEKYERSGGRIRVMV